jgi:hypothetical protein
MEEESLDVGYLEERKKKNLLQGTVGSGISKAS